MRLAAYNVENLFERARALNLPTAQEAKPILSAQAEINVLFKKPRYSAADLRRIKALLETLGLDKADDSRFAILRQNRGKLRKRVDGELTITATGAEDWIGWVELKTEPVNQVAIMNTARVIALMEPDILAVVEAENRPSLKRFSEAMLATLGTTPFPHIMLVDGNDDRGIDVGLGSGAAFAIRSVASHVDDRDARGNTIFSRDCPEYEVVLPSGQSLWVLINHFKSKGFGDKGTSDAKRKAQATRTRAIYEARIASGARFVAIVGDLNDTPDSDPLAPLLGDGTLRDVSEHPAYESDGRPGTYANGTKGNKIDYIILSPDLFAKVKRAGVERRGVWGGKNGTLFPHLPEITRAEEAASDHAGIWVDLDV